MSAATAPKPTEPSRLDQLVTRLRDRADAWAALPVGDKIALARSMFRGIARVAERSVAAACAAKGIPAGSPLEGEEWIGGPWIDLRILRQTIGSLESTARHGNTPLKKVARSADGRLLARVFPASTLDALLFPGVRGDVRLEEGVGEEELRDTRARLYREKARPGRVCLVLGAGNQNSIPPTDVVHKMFNEGKVCVLKMNPVNAYLGPFIEEAFAEAVQGGFLAVAYGGVEEGAYLARHPAVDEIHITGSDKTHDLLVWGPPGPERAERMARNRPLLDKEITSELGNVSPVLVVPGPYSTRQLSVQAESVAGMVTQNASFNCNAAKMLVTPRGWSRRGELLDLVERFMGAAPARRAWYPGARERYRALTDGRRSLRKVGSGEDALPWTLVADLDAADEGDKAFTTEPFCSILSEAPIASDDPVEFLDRAVAFANQRLWGTLNATIVVHPETLRDRQAAEAMDRAVAGLRYGTVGVNVWPAFAFAMGTAPWGAYPGSTLHDIQSGRGFVHNTLMLDRIEKCVVQGPITPMVKYPYFPTHRTLDVVGRRLTGLEASGSWLGVPGVVAAAMRG